MMSIPQLTCQDETRRDAVRVSDRLNGLDYLEVEIVEEEDRQQVFLCVHFLGPIPSIDQVHLDNIHIEGGERIRNVRAIGLSIHTPNDPSIDGCLKIEVNKLGDFSPYTLSFIGLQSNDIPDKLRLDPRYDSLQFFFRAGCPSDLDCKTQPICPPEVRSEPEINYLAKDYASFRQLILDRLALIMPDWNERHVPDLGIVLVEILAYVGDYLSYFQDAVATEAYLNTARQRISVRRHVRLVDYPMHEGCNARTWVWLETSQDYCLNLSEAFFTTSYPNAPGKGTVLLANDFIHTVRANQYEVFEPLVANNQSEMELYQAHNEILFYTWGNRQCCLPIGTISATLLDEWELASSNSSESSQYNYETDDDCGDSEPQLSQRPARKLRNLRPGDLLIFEEIRGAKTGNKADADPSHRHVIRLTKVDFLEDPLFFDTSEEVADDRYSTSEHSDHTSAVSLPIPIVAIEWLEADALPFPLCISAIGPAPDCLLIAPISVARGNVILVDHGRTTKNEDLGTVQEQEVLLTCEAECQPAEAIIHPERFRPKIQQIPLTFSQPLSDRALLESPAAHLHRQDPRRALPQITLFSKLLEEEGEYNSSSQNEESKKSVEATAGEPWIPKLDLIGSKGQDRHFVVEMDDESRAHLRFGNDELGYQPDAGTHFSAMYRLGNGTKGNIGADTLAYLVIPESLNGIQITPHNPLPAQGGTSQELIAKVKLAAPHAFRKELQRAITPQDYATIVMRDFNTQVQRAAATFCWTGSWYEVLVAVDPRGTEVADPMLLQDISNHLELYRQIGHDVVVKSAVYVFLDIAMLICVKSNYLKGQVKAALLDVFSNRQSIDGRLGFFHPDNLTFGVGISLSKLVAAAQAVPGVQSATVTKLQRFAEPPNKEIEQGVLRLNSLEIARLDNDPNFPERGKFSLEMRGGR